MMASGLLVRGFVTVPTVCSRDMVFSAGCIRRWVVAVSCLALRPRLLFAFQALSFFHAFGGALDHS